MASRPVLLFLGGFCLGLAVSSIAVHSYSGKREIIAIRQSSLEYSAGHKDTYPLIDPLLTVRANEVDSTYSALKKEVTNYISQQKANGLESAAVAFRDINAIDGFNINGTETYFLASLNKVYILLAYLKIAESNPKILSERLTYDGKEDANAIEEIKSTVQLVPHTTYSVNELLERLILHSDNNAANLLGANLETTERRKIFESVLGDLNVNPIEYGKAQDNLTAPAFSLVLGTLYNATFLNNDSSERALELLSRSEFKDGLVAGVATGTLVAHKFGEARVAVNGSITGKELHDCGVIYSADHPYRLCIMTKGQGIRTEYLESVIAHITSLVDASVRAKYSALR